VRDVKDREDLLKVVSSFYSKIKTNKDLGHIFTQAIPENEWEEHMQKITDFWHSALFGSATYSGSPADKHVQLDKTNNYSLNHEHFKTWLTYWNSNLDSLFTGETATNMKLRAEKMASGLYASIWYHKPDAHKPSLKG